MNDLELNVYDSWFNPMVSYLPGLVPDGFIYLRAQPETCHKRLQQRAREEESKVSLDYLANLHDKHEGWLYPHLKGHDIFGDGRFNHRLMGNNGNVRLHQPWPGDVCNTPVPEMLRGRVFGISGADLHPSIQNVSVKGSKATLLMTLMNSSFQPNALLLWGRNLSRSWCLISILGWQVPALVLDCNPHIDFSVTSAQMHL